MKIIWSKTAELSFAEELDYIFRKRTRQKTEKLFGLSINEVLAYLTL